MKVTEEQLDEYIALYERDYGDRLERTVALEQVHNLINLVLYMALPEHQILKLEHVLKKDYTHG